MKNIIETNNLSKIYYRGAEVIKAVNSIDLAIQQGEFISFVGPSGSGKTTLLHLLGCLDSPSTGGIKIDGKEVFRENVKSNESKLTTFRRDYFGYKESL